MGIQYLTLSSRDRSSGTEGAATFQFTDILSLPRGTELYITNFALPMTNFTVITGVNDVIPSDLGDTTLTAGVHNITALLAHIETAMSTATSTTITCSVSNYLVTIASTGTPTLTWTDSTHSAARLLGWDPDTDVVAGASHTSPNPYDLSRPHFVHITLAQIPFVNIQIASDPVRHAHFSIPVTAANGDVLMYAPRGVFVKPIGVVTPLGIKQLTVTLTDEEGNDFVRSDWTLELRLRFPEV